MKHTPIAAVQAGVLLGALLLWEILPRIGLIDPLFIPPPSQVVAAAVHLSHHGGLSHHILISLKRALGGLAAGMLIALPLGLALGGWFPRLTRALEPLMELFAQANPVLLFHIIILFLGIGESAKLFIITWLCLWPITFSIINGIRTVDPQILKVGRALGLGRLRLFGQVVMPSAAPHLFTGLRLAAGYAFIMLIAAEMMGAASGLGWLVIQNQESYHAPRIFAGAAIITALGITVDTLLKALERRVVAWQPPIDAVPSQLAV